MNSHASQIASRLKCQAGAALVEFALVVPVFLLLLLGMFDFGKVFNYWNDATHLSHEGARFAAVDKIPDPDSPTLADWLRARADTTELRDGSTSVTGPIDVCLRFPEGNSDVGSPVTVQVKFTYEFMSYLGVGLPKEITQESTMRIERPIKNLADEPICPT